MTQSPNNKMSLPLTIGVLALQGDYEAHRAVLDELGANSVLVRKPDQLAGLDGLVIPGGESSTFLKFLEREGFLSKLRDFVSTKPTFGTCAGAILLAKNVENPSQESLDVLDVAIRRNAYGRQVDSTIIESQTSLGAEPLEMVFIRAPKITRTGDSVEVLALRDSDPVLVRQNNILAATFHPELSQDRRVHQMFLDQVRKSKSSHAVPQTA
jgi:pyridoxal 5'-phosphate synthase pdxT subunit